jgi:polyisoprenoid-binding protein YceI
MSPALKLIALILVSSFFAGGRAAPLPQPSSAPRTALLTVDPVHSFMIFKVKHLGAGYVYGRFTEPAGTVEIDDATGDVVAASFEIKSMTLDTAVVKRDEHLKGPEFLNVKKFPEITFKSTAVKIAGKDVYEVTGDLTLVGEKRPIVVRATRIGTGKAPDGTVVTGFESNFVVKRSEFGIKTMPEAIDEDILMTFACEVSKR